MMARDDLLRRIAPAKDRMLGLLQRIVLRSYLLGLAVAAVFGTSYLALTGRNGATPASATLVQAERRTITSAVKATGKVTFASEQELRFNQKGTVATVNVKLGDAVRRGQVIAELDQSSVLADIRQAELSLSASALQMQQLQSQKQQTLTDAENAARETERQLTQAQNDLAVSQQKLPADLAAAKRALAEKQTAYTQAQLDLEKQKATELQSLASTAQGTFTTAEDLLDSFYTVLTNDASARPPSGNYSLEIYHLLYNDLGSKQQVENSYMAAVNGVKAMQDEFGTGLATQRDPSVILRALAQAKTVAFALYQLGEGTYAMLQGAATGATGFTVADLNALRSTASTNRSKATALMQSLETAQANLTAVSSSGGIPSVTLKAKQDALTAAGHALAQAQENLKILQKQTPANLQQQQNMLQKLQEDLQSKQAGTQTTQTTTAINIRLKQNDVAQKATSVQKARKVLQDYRLTAPFDGVITRMDYKVGDNLLDTGDTAFVVLQNPDAVVVTIPLDQVDVVRVRKDMPATITFDAVPDQTSTGAIDAIDAVPVESSGVVSYNVAIKLPAPQGLTILSGMTATVEIETRRKEGVLAVPNLALSRTNGVASVQGADGRTVRVETGVTDGRYTEIISGLQVGESIVSLNVAATQATTNANAAQIFRFGGGMGGPDVRTGGTRGFSR